MRHNKITEKLTVFQPLDLSLQFVFILGLVVPTKSFAEYRAFELKIMNIESGTEKTVVSTLDHLQYAQYYPILKGEVVSYLASWRCRGNTSQFKRICQNPNTSSNN